MLTVTDKNLTSYLASSRSWKKVGNTLVSPSGRVLDVSRCTPIGLKFVLSLHANAVLAGQL